MVDYTLTPNKSLLKPNRGTYVDTWDVPINNDWDYVDRALGGSYAISVQAVPANPVILTNDQARYQQLAIANQTAIISVQLPLIEGSSTVAVGGMWIVDNGSNTFDVYLSTLAPGTNTLTLKSGKRYTVFSNGTGVFFADDSRLEASASSGLKIVGNAISIEGVNSVLTTERGGTGFSNGYVSGQLLIGKADGTLTRGTLTAGTNVTIENGDGTIKINSTGGSGTGGLTSIGLNTTLSGLAFDPSTINTTNTSTTLKGTLGISSGGTGTDFKSATNPGIIKLSGVSLTSVAAIDINTETSGTLGVGRGGTGTASWTLNGRGVGAVWASGLTTLTSGTLPVTAGGTGISTVTTANQAVFSSGTDVLTTGTLPVQAGGTGLTQVQINASNLALYSLGAGVLTAGTLPVGAGGTGLTATQINAANLAVYSSGTGALTAGTLPVAAGGTGLATIATANQALYSSNINTITAGTLPVLAGGTGVTTATGTAGNLVLSGGPTLTGLTTVERISATATGTNDTITSRVSTDTNFTYIGKNAAGVNKFTVTGSGAVTSAQITNTTLINGVGNGFSDTYARFNSDTASKWAAEFWNPAGPVTVYRCDVITQPLLSFYYLDGATLRNIGTISVNSATTVAYNTTSDYRVKENIVPYASGLDKIKQLRPVTFSWKDRPASETVAGFIAHEVQAVIPNAVTGEKDAVNEDGTPRLQGIDNSFIVPHLVSAIKELTARVEALEAKVGPS